MPAVVHERGDGERGDRDRRDALLGSHACMARNALDRDVHPIATGGADRDLLDRAAVEVEGQLRLAEISRLHEPGAVEADLFLDREQQRERRVRELRLQNLHRGGEHHRHARAVVAAEAGGWVGALDHLAGDHRLRAAADGHRVHVGHQQPPRPRQRAGQLHDQVAGVALHRRLGVRRVEGDRPGRAARVAEPLHDPLRDRLLVARHARDREQVEDDRTGGRQIGQRHGGGRGGWPLRLRGGAAYTGGGGRGGGFRAGGDAGHAMLPRDWLERRPR